MIKNYFKTAFRGLAKNKAYSALNILGLATAIPLIFVISGTALISIRATIENPVKSLRTAKN